MSDGKRIELWLNTLAILTESARDRTPSAEMIASYARILGNSDVPVAAFTEQSVAAVAAECTYWPPYATLLSKVLAWWKVNRPAFKRLALPAPDGEAQLGHDDQQWLDYYSRRQGQILDPGYLPRWGSANADLENLAVRVDPGRRHHTEAVLERCLDDGRGAVRHFLHSPRLPVSARLRSLALAGRFCPIVV